MDQRWETAAVALHYLEGFSSDARPIQINQTIVRKPPEEIARSFGA